MDQDLVLMAVMLPRWRGPSQESPSLPMPCQKLRQPSRSQPRLPPFITPEEAAEPLLPLSPSLSVLGKGSRVPSGARMRLPGMKRCRDIPGHHQFPVAWCGTWFMCLQRPLGSSVGFCFVVWWWLLF